MKHERRPSLSEKAASPETLPAACRQQPVAAASPEDRQIGAAGISSRLAAYGQSYLDTAFFPDLLAFVRADQSDFSPIDSMAMESILDWYREHAGLLRESKNIHVKKFAEILDLLFQRDIKNKTAVGRISTDKKIQARKLLTEFVRGFFGDSRERNERAKELLASWRSEFHRKFGLEESRKDDSVPAAISLPVGDSPENKPLAQEIAGSGLVAENAALKEEIHNLRQQLEDAFHQNEALKATVAEQVEVPKLQEELPQEIIEALRTWPGGRRTPPGGGRPENPEVFVSRVFQQDALIRKLRENPSALTSPEARAAELRTEITAFQAVLEASQLTFARFNAALSHQAEADVLQRHMETVASVLAQKQAELQRLLAEIQELPQQIIAALREWPTERKTVEGVDGKTRKENAEQFIERIFTDYYDQQGGYDPLRHPRLHPIDLINNNVNRKLYASLTAINSRRGTSAQCIIWKAQEVSQRLTTAVASQDGDLNGLYRRSSSLASSAQRELAKFKARSPS